MFQNETENMQESSVVTPSSPSSHTNVSPIKVDFMKISLQNEKHHCRLGRVSAAIIWSLSASTPLELEPHFDKGGGNLTPEKKNLPVTGSDSYSHSLNFRWNIQILSL